MVFSESYLLISDQIIVVLQYLTCCILILYFSMFHHFLLPIIENLFLLQTLQLFFLQYFLILFDFITRFQLSHFHLCFDNEQFQVIKELFFFFSLRNPNPNLMRNYFTFSFLVKLNRLNLCYLLFKFYQVMLYSQYHIETL